MKCMTRDRSDGRTPVKFSLTALIMWNGISIRTRLQSIKKREVLHQRVSPIIIRHSRRHILLTTTKMCLRSWICRASGIWIRRRKCCMYIRMIRMTMNIFCLIKSLILSMQKMQIILCLTAFNLRAAVKRGCALTSAAVSLYKTAG